MVTLMTVCVTLLLLLVSLVSIYINFTTWHHSNIQTCVTAVIWDHDTDDWRMNEVAGFKPEWIAGNASEWAANSKSGISLEHDLYKETVDAAIKIYPTLKVNMISLDVFISHG